MDRIRQILDAAAQGDIPTLGRLLDAEPSLVNARTESGQTPVLAAVYAGQREAARFLLERGAETDLFEACAAGQLERVRAFVTHDPGSADSWSPDGFAPLHLACFFGHTAIVEYLVSAGADVNAVSRNVMGVTPLHSAAAVNHVQAVRFLVARGANVNAVQHGGYTALHSAAANGEEQMVRLLLDAGADPAARTEDGRTPADMARTRGHQAIAALLSRPQGASATS